MKKIKEKQNIPEGWSQVLLGDIVSVTTGKRDANHGSEDGVFPFFTCAQKVSKIDDYSFDKEAVLVAGNGDFNVKYYKGKFDAYQRTYVLSDFRNTTGHFVYHKVKQALNHIMRNNQGSSVKFIKMGDLTNYEFLFPPIQEQQKIAEILGVVDEDIAKTRGVIDATEKLKRGLMQKLFTRGIGHTKFKKTKLGEIPEGWEIGSVEDLLVSIVGGGTPSRKESKYWGGNIPWMTVKDMSNKKYIYDAEEYITEKGLKESSANLISENSIITSTRMGIGRVYISKIPIAINQDLKGLILKDDFVLDYVYWMLSSLARKFEAKGSGSTVKGIRLEEYKSVEIVLTRNKTEQQKIAEILSTVDEKISVNKKLLAKLTKLKKGLMQDLLSGGVRVKV